MRYVASLVSVALAVGVMLWASPVLGQAGVKNAIQGTLNKALQEHNDQLSQAEGNAGNTPPTPAANQAKKDLGWMERTVNGNKVRMYAAHPDLARYGEHPNLPALLVVQEWWGVNDDIIKRTEEFAGKGYYAVAVDLYDGKVTQDPMEAAAMKAKMTDAAALLRLRTGLDYLVELSHGGYVDLSKVGVIGWCMGGQYTLVLATEDPRVKATIVYYGMPMTDLKKLANIKGPVLGIFGENDTSIPVTTVKQFQAALNADKITNDITIYSGVGHAFASPSAAAMKLYNPDKANEANTKMFDWLKVNLPPRK